MNKTKLMTILLLAVVLCITVVVNAKSDKQVRPKKVSPNVVSEIKATPTGPSQMPTFTGTRQGYQMVIDVLDSFGGESESDNYRIPANSGGQPSVLGISESISYGIKAGYVYASHIRRGDTNSDEIINIGDAIYVLNYLFKEQAGPCPMEAGDVNCDGGVNLGDAIFLLNYLFKGGSAPTC